MAWKILFVYNLHTCLDIIVSDWFHSEWNNESILPGDDQLLLLFETFIPSV